MSRPSKLSPICSRSRSTVCSKTSAALASFNRPRKRSNADHTVEKSRPAQLSLNQGNSRPYNDNGSSTNPSHDSFTSSSSSTGLGLTGTGFQASLPTIPHTPGTAGLGSAGFFLGGNTPLHSRHTSWDDRFVDAHSRPSTTEHSRPGSAKGYKGDEDRMLEDDHTTMSQTGLVWIGKAMSTPRSFFKSQLSKLISIEFKDKGKTPEYFVTSPIEKGIPPQSYSKYDKATTISWIGVVQYHFSRIRRLAFGSSRRTSALLLLLCLLLYLFSTTIVHFIKSARFLGGGSKFVIILATNQGGGVLSWKGAEQWAVERYSLPNKVDYARRHGYHLEVRDSRSLKRYAHEWRESWEKVDVIRQTMRKYPKAEWFWYLDVQTFIMEPRLSLEKHIFNRLDKVVFRDVNVYNPLNITHPPTAIYLDDVAKSLEGDRKADSINLVIPQDCGGFNMGSFFARRSEYLDRLMDIWWDPVGYEQQHAEWQHKEQDVLAHLYRHQPWVRNGIAFIPQRMINSYPPGACSDKPNDERLFYKEKDRDFMINLAGCEWGRSCGGEMQHYRNISLRLNEKKWFW